MYCSNCGKKVNNGTKYCPHCGAKVGSGGAEKPVAAYVVKNPDLQYTKAQKLIKNTLALGILECVGIFWIIMMLALTVAISGPAATGLAVAGSLLIEGCGIAAFVLTIIIWTRWRAIKENTEVSHLWATVGYSVSMGINFVVSIVVIVLLAIPNVPVSAIISFFCIQIFFEAFDIFISFYLHHKIKTTIHR